MAEYSDLPAETQREREADGRLRFRAANIALHVLDREFVRLLQTGAREALLAFLDQRLPSAGNGTAEVRNWLAAHGAAGEQGFDLIHYSPMPEIYVGGGFASWHV